MGFTRKDYSELTLEQLEEERVNLLSEKEKYEQHAYDAKQALTDARAYGYAGRHLPQERYNELQNAHFQANKQVKYIDYSLSAARSEIKRRKNNDFLHTFYELAKSKLEKKQFMELFLEANEIEEKKSEPITQ